jgi:hypothetical protein
LGACAPNGEGNRGKKEKLYKDFHNITYNKMKERKEARQIFYNIVGKWLNNSDMTKCPSKYSVI